MTRTQRRGPARIKCHGSTLACKVAHKSAPILTEEIFNRAVDSITKPVIEITQPPKKWWQIWKS